MSFEIFMISLHHHLAISLTALIFYSEIILTDYEYHD